VINENFLIKLRDCVLKLPESHPVKRWMKWVASSKPLDQKDGTRKSFLTEIINSQFNLITELSMRNKIIKLIQEVPENTLSEQVLKSYLYLMIGNVTRSDNILRQIINTSPRVNWERSGLKSSLFHKIARDEFSKIFSKLSRHPADRRTFELFVLYLRRFYNDELLMKMADDVDTSEVEQKLSLKYIEGLAPAFIHYLRISNMSENRRFKMMRNVEKYPYDEQSYWLWPFLDINPLISDAMNPELLRLEKNDELWFIYLMDNEKLADLFSRKSGKSFLPGRRPYLKEALNSPASMMMSLYKLIELGDINQDLVMKVTDYLVHE
jgi:hypothetical protein